MSRNTAFYSKTLFDEDCQKERNSKDSMAKQHYRWR